LTFSSLLSSGALDTTISPLRKLVDPESKI
jgi:hypothetical protein